MLHVCKQWSTCHVILLAFFDTGLFWPDMTLRYVRVCVCVTCYTNDMTSCMDDLSVKYFDIPSISK